MAVGNIGSVALTWLKGLDNAVQTKRSGKAADNEIKKDDVATGLKSGSEKLASDVKYKFENGFNDNAQFDSYKGMGIRLPESLWGSMNSIK
jgi:hypothetical protein